jgi:tRNA C32,U32 (ribose-2'-O)-methylase TrmJ
MNCSASARGVPTGVRIGASARAMKTMGISDLRLVRRRAPAPEAQWMAAHAGDVLAQARVYPQLGDALADCVAAFALSARPREWSPQVLDPRAAARRALERAAGGSVAFVFGAESAG